MATIGLIAMSLLVTVQNTGDAAPDQRAWEGRVTALIRQLGDNVFAKREAATKALLAEGDRIVPLLDKARRNADLELTRRIDRIRLQLVGYFIDLTDYLKTLPQTDRESLPEIPESIRALVARHQPKTGSFLLRLIADPAEPLNRPATHLFCGTWQSGTAAHLRTYFDSSFRLQAFHRERYPHGIDAFMETRFWQQHGWIGWPRDLVWQTRTTHFIDGQPHGKPFVYKHPGGGATTGWINAGKLPLGNHKLRFEVEFEFTHQGEKHQGRVRSPEFAFSVVPPAPANDLIAATNAEQNNQIRQGLLILEHDGQDLSMPQLGAPRGAAWQPQVTWEEPPGKRRGLRLPEWWVKAPLPVDLCFDVEILDLQSGKRHAGDALVLRKGETGRGYFMPRDARAFCQGRDGFVEIEIELQPSRSAALTDPKVTAYFGLPITSKKLRAKVFNDVKSIDGK